MEDQGDDGEREKRLAALKRLLSTNMDERAGAILTYHAALEAEVGRFLAVLLPRGDLLNLGYSNGVRILQAAYFAEPDKVDALVEFLRLFGELRNAIAHADPKAKVNGWIAKLRAHYEAMPGSDVSHKLASVEDMASDILGTLGGIIFHLEKMRPPYPPSPSGTDAQRAPSRDAPGNANGEAADP